MLEPAEVRAFIDGFNRSPVADATGTCMGGIRVAGDVLTVTVRSDGHVWRLVYPATCIGLTVTEDGREMPGIAPDAKFRHLLEVLAHFDGSVKGRLLLVGGPAGRAPGPLTGRLTLSSGGHVFATVTTRSRRGYFVLTAQPGRYDLAGTSPHYNVNGHPGTCTATHTVTVRTDKTTHADVYCNAR